MLLEDVDLIFIWTIINYLIKQRSVKNYTWILLLALLEKRLEFGSRDHEIIGVVEHFLGHGEQNERYFRK